MFTLRFGSLATLLVSTALAGRVACSRLREHVALAVFDMATRAWPCHPSLLRLRAQPALEAQKGT